jgi:hypothetical protein
VGPLIDTNTKIVLLQRIRVFYAFNDYMLQREELVSELVSEIALCNSVIVSG